jgi:hypothetical protein
VKKHSDRFTCTHGVNVGSAYSNDQLAFLQALDRYKRSNHRPHPSCCEVLAVVESLGWRRVAEPGPLPKVEDMPC